MTPRFSLSTPRPAVADPGLKRPDWTKGELRDPARLWLDKNENSDPRLAAVVREVVAGIAPSFQYSYPETPPVYRKLAAFLELKPENLIFAAGSDGLIRAVFEAFVSPGDTVIHTAPTFAMYFVYSKMYGAREVVLTYEPSATGPSLPAGRIVEAIDREGPKAVFLPNPDSPTGTWYPPDEMRVIIEAAGRAGALMLVDEAYWPFHPETCLPWVEEFPHLLVTRSTGKAWGLAGFRIGYGAASPELAAILHKVRAMYEVNAFGLAVFEAMIHRWKDIEASVARLEAGKWEFLDAMRSLGLKTLKGRGNFLHVAFGDRAEKIHAALADMVYYRADFAEPCLKGFSRFSAAPPDMMQPLAVRIQEIFR